MKAFTIKFDGACTKPGGTASYGFIIYQDAVVIATGHGIIGHGEGMTNNVAEHYALMKGLEKFLEFKPQEFCYVQVLGDSNMVIQQVAGRWRARTLNAPYIPYYLKNIEIIKQLRKSKTGMTFQWIPREKNQECDDLSKLNA